METTTVEHDVVRKRDGKTVGTIASTWIVAIPGEFTVDGYPAGGILDHFETFGAVPESVRDYLYGDTRAFGEIRPGMTFDKARAAAAKYRIVPRSAPVQSR